MAPGASDAVYPSLEGRTVLNTGGASGIGASPVEHFCRQQARVSVLDLQREAGEDLVGRLGAGGNVSRFLACDLRDVDALQAADGLIAVLIDSAAADDGHTIEDVTPLDAEGEAEIARRQCLKDKVRPDDIARMVLFLAADDSRMCTAQNFIVDAGWI